MNNKINIRYLTYAKYKNIDLFNIYIYDLHINIQKLGNRSIVATSCHCVSTPA